MQRIVWLLLLVVSITGCTHGVLGSIPPSTFQFTTVTEHDGTDAGGWQIAQVLVLLGRLSAMYPRAAVCQIEVGMPVVNRGQGYISEERAQEASARASDSAARKLLGQPARPTASACFHFRETMKEFLAGIIYGATVGPFLDWPGHDLPRRSFPPRRGR